MNDVKIFENPEFGRVRTTVIDGEPWFVAADVCHALDIGNPSDALNRLDDDERTLVSIEGASNGKPVNGVNEPGLYSLVLGSRKPEAKAFKRWITHEVIPAIRKTGGYQVPQSPAEQMAQGIDIGQKRLFAWMRENGFLIKSGTEKNMPTQRVMDMKLFEVKEGSFVDGNGVNRITRTTKVTGKGQVYFVNKFLNGSKAVLE